MASIDIAAVRKSYGATPVLRGIDLTIANGEFVVLVGPSGCGKSTLLRLIAGLELIDKGEIRIGGRRVNDLPPKDRDLAMVFQSYALYPHMSVRDNMSYALRLRKTPKEKIAAALKGASAKLGLDALIERKPRALSGGQRQRVAMGRAIVRDPQAFLFDEPLSNLDARLREQMRFEIKKLHRDLGATSVYVTHDQIEAMTMADRIVAMNEGVIQQVGSPSDLYDNPANLFVAGFIGSPAMNFLQARTVAGPGGMSVTVGQAEIAKVPPATPTGPVVLGLRPERITLTAPGQGAQAAVDLVEPTGLGMIVHLDLDGQQLKTFTTERLPLKAGERVGLMVPPGSFCLFAPGTGERLAG
ncbi:ABC transporter ATP-binding protein [Lichenifustis flavocetrariae]|uniref:Sn-glycerol-3-phosphate ABC transporter ATP-binding protein UgpC n=1 Tax=Lichenifustis flavocetrariae TaxID=2949735 RepID=A0AA42CN18_9HYPH|nr:sn-glycerol-3-phosphate ABC transporter ATP-binding protein UgpC [Lichenifustis flavocetrariae]MCW6508930.1 sn-glycerol-3-phosphate ABC transporter ATP-binding protein UgpC [Lichenifustis flavocetrariae]